SHTVRRYVPPGKNITHLRLIIRELYTLHTDPVESDYGAAFFHLARMQKRQSFILLFSDLDPFLQAGMPLNYLRRMARQRPLLLIGIANPALPAWAQSTPRDKRQAMLVSMAQKELLHRKQELKRLEACGLQALEASEETLAAEALSEYLQVIERGVL
ncbi:MAG: DUF58 domain-containing protein, partial [Peptococcaceae bacterium]|nr:DUF58 domain-containing protein [Peptococcaceae bacterium]